MDYYRELLKVDRPERYTTLLGAAVATVATALFVKSVVNKSKEYKSPGGREIPSPKGDYFYLGHLPLLGKRPGLTITKWHQELGPIFRIKVGSQNWVFVGDVEAAHELLVSKGSATAGRPEMTYLTKVHSPGVSSLWIMSLSHILDREAQQVVDIMRDQAKVNEEVDPHLFTRLAGMNLMLAIAYGVPGAKSVEEPDFKKVEYFSTMAMRFSSPSEDFSVIFPSLKFLDVILRKEKRMIDFRDKEFFPYVRNTIKLARESKEDSLVKKMDEIRKEYGLDEQSILCLLSETLTAGTDTTSVGTAWAIGILCHHPEVQKKLCDEIDAFIRKHGRQPAFSDREELPYFIAFEKECLRFRAPTDLGLPHKVLKDVVYKDYIIPKGHIIYVNVHTLHNDPQVFPEPEKFMPERFLNDTRSMYASSNGAIQNRDHFAFGWGRRICPGIYLAESQIFHLLTKILATSTIEPAISSTGEKIYPDLDNVIDTGITVGPVPFKIRLVERMDRVLA
ncbi:hypothetical protein G6F46_004333 [Rhizopus delemar]|uniref:Cytochrome P450 n=2 Tax=Rhizopus TaxID=4842 RepID=A0A9P6Z6X6_9FUNG|nr:hypothetical protein G6F55_003050 [Rhizopus delemar]KAG1547017.1 hypothetical protein G6F51_004522 [Rhizopus arrhizus]KAG1500436.1 hypothetical protein G6F54_003723 [Rhizopus delemar]KAG1514148.1 hypothetical protein G6F53_003902 [Rhizopus delemar]KAG1525760.1 hypothetical protein G6F52_003036 [Rhizopus delemar]